MNEPLAIIGIGCRFPGGSDSPQAFWDMLCAGTDAIREIPTDLMLETSWEAFEDAGQTLES
jgi:acyl transferase domain-containing protein